MSARRSRLYLFSSPARAAQFVNDTIEPGDRLRIVESVIDRGDERIVVAVASAPQEVTDRIAYREFDQIEIEEGIADDLRVHLSSMRRPS